MSESAPTLEEVLSLAIARGSRALRVCLPARVESFDAVKQTANVKPLLRETIFGEDGIEVSESLPVVPHVPVQFPGGGGFAETWPVAAGDPCLLVFSDRSIDLWQERGAEVDPVDLRKHAYSDAIAILGVRSKPGALAEFDGSRAVWGNKGPRVAADGITLHLGVTHGASATQSAVRGETYRTAEDTLLTALETATDTAGGLLSAAGVSLLAAAPLNAIPVVGGIPAAPLFLSAGASLTAAGSALNALHAAIETFKAGGAGYLQTGVKVP